MSQQNNFFSLFGLRVQFELDLTELTNRYRNLQKQLHPDKFASGSGSERALSVQQAAMINDAYAVLKSPLLRAKYILELNDVPVNESSNSIMDPEFLMQQMEMRESLESVKTASDPLGALDSIVDQIDEQVNKLKAHLRKLFLHEKPNFEEIADDVRKWQFFSRLQVEADEMYSRYEKM
jgi:molecular chaperone HscB